MNLILDDIGRVGDLINGDLVSTDLNTILSGLCDLIRNQQAEINNLKEEIAKQPSSDKIETEIRVNENQIKQLAEKVNRQLEESSSTIEEFSKLFFEMRNSMNNDIHKQGEQFQEFTKEIAEQFKQQRIVTGETQRSLINNSLAMQNQIDEVKRANAVLQDLLENVGMSNVQTLSEKLKEINDSINDLTTDNNEIHKYLDGYREFQAKEAKNNQKEIDTQIMIIKKQISEIQEQYSVVPDFHDMIQNEEADWDLMPIIRAVHRDSRRLDGFNEMISGIRLECQNVATSMEGIETTMQQFHHCIHDSQINVEANRNDFMAKFQIVTQFNEWLCNLFTDTWSSIGRLTEMNKHLSNSVSASLDNISKAFNCLTQAPLPNINLLDECLVESSQVSEMISERRSNLDVSKHFYEYKRDIEKAGHDTVIKVQNIGAIPSFERKMPPLQVSSYVMDAGNVLPQSVEVKRDNLMVMKQLEDIRTRSGHTEAVVQDFVESFKKDIIEVKDEMKSKMDILVIDRVIAKIQKTMGKLQKNIDFVINNMSEMNAYEFLDSPIESRSRESPPVLNPIAISPSRTPRRTLQAINQLTELSAQLSSAPSRRPKSGIMTPNGKRSRNRSPTDGKSKTTNKKRLATTMIDSPR